MKKLFLIVITSTLISCAHPKSELGMAIIFDTVEPIAISSNKKANKVGKACGKNVLGIVTMGDISIDTARKNGNISYISSVDKSVKGHILVADVCTIVRGN